MISHEYKLVHFVSLLRSILTEHIEKVAERDGLQNEAPLPGDEGSKESAEFLRRAEHDRARRLYHALRKSPRLKAAERYA